MSTQHQIMTREVRTSQRGVRIHYIEVDGAATTPSFAATGLIYGRIHADIREDAAGEYTVRLKDPGERLLHVAVSEKGNTPADWSWDDTATKGEVKLYGPAITTFTAAIHMSIAADET